MINITDIFGNNNINNNTPFLIIYNSNLKPYLVIKDKFLNESELNSIKSYIYTLNYKLLIKDFKNINLDINNFLLSSDIFVYENEQIVQLLLINKSIYKAPLDYISVEFYNNGTLWEPIGNAGYKSLGLIYNKGNDKPELYEIPLLPVDILVRIKNGPSTGSQSVSEFKNLSNNIHGFWTLDRSKISNDTSDYFKLLTYDGKYLTKINDKFVLINNKNKPINPEQVIKYTINGDIIVDNKCLTNKLNFKNCNKSTKFDPALKWSLINNNIISNKDNKCLTINNNDIILQECSNGESQQFSKEYLDYKATMTDDFKWKNIRGKSVVLTHNDNPWYLNKDISQQYNFSTSINNDQVKGYLKNNVTLSPIKKHHIAEGFEDNKTYNLLTISIIIITILIVIIVYKYRKSLLRIN
jgi:hypothetical protein